MITLTCQTVAWADTTVSANITTDTTWTLAGSPYIITGYITVQGATSAGATLTIEPGVVVKFNQGRYLSIGASSDNPGALVAKGTGANPIIFTSNQATPTAGHWSSLRFYNTADDAISILEHCAVQYAGGGSLGAVYISQASPTIRNCTISSSSIYGIKVGTGAPTVDGCQFGSNGNYDIYYTGTIGGTIANCTIYNGMYLLCTGNMGFSGNMVHQNDSFPIKAYADNVSALVNGCTFNDVTSASYLEISGNTITKDATWTAAIPYLISGYLSVQGVDGADAITTLSIAPGAVLKFNQSRYLKIGASSGNPGALIAQGTASNPIVFTSNQATPTAGYWSNIKIDNTANDTITVLNNCVFEYGGSSGQGMLNLTDAKPTIAYSTFRYSSHAAIYVSGAGANDASIKCNTFSNNLYGLYVSSALPAAHENNFGGNSNYGLYFSGTGTLNAEYNWWGATAGPNTTGDSTYGNVDADPWSLNENACIVVGENHPPYEPNMPSPANNAVRVAITSGSANLQWAGDDPDVLDRVTYDIRWGTSAENLTLLASNVATKQHVLSGLSQGISYYWQVTARDNSDEETAGPVWRFTTNGDTPDLIVSVLSTQPAGHIQSGQAVTLSAQIHNTGTGPVVDAFTVSFSVDGTVIAGASLSDIIPADGTAVVNGTWTYTGGDPNLEVTVDSQGAVSETNEENNRWIALLSEIADNAPPALVSASPTAGAVLNQLQEITVTMADSKSAINDAAVLASLIVRDANQQSVAGTRSESNDTFGLTPYTLPLPDGMYQVSLTAVDTYGNAQAYGFTFTIDTQLPGKPIITGGTVASGTIQPRPAQNSADQFNLELHGTRDPGTSVWINGVQKVPAGDNAWLVPLMLEPDGNILEIWLEDIAGNRGASEWVDISLSTGTVVNFEYDAAGRTKRIHSDTQE